MSLDTSFFKVNNKKIKIYNLTLILSSVRVVLFVNVYAISSAP
jgi:hypothetical protein